MHLALIGVGGAGTRIVDQILAYEAEIGRGFSDGHVLAIDTDNDDLDTLDQVPADRRVVLGELHPAVGDDGVAGDVDLGVEVAREDLDEVRRALDPLPMHELDGVLLAAGLGGGTGCGVGAVVLEELAALYEEPVYVLGVLPSDEDGDETALTAARSLLSIVPTADNVFAFDNEAWFSDDRDDGANRRHANRDLAIRIVSLLSDGTDETSLPENRIDPSDLARTLETGGVSSIGYASTELDRYTGLLGWLRRRLGMDGTNDPVDPTQVRDLVRRAATSRLTLPCDLSSTERVAVIVAGPPDVLSRKGFENARNWLEEETGSVEIRAGDQPRPGSSTLSVVVLFSNVTSVERIDAIQGRAVKARGERSIEGFGWDTPETS